MSTIKCPHPGFFRGLSAPLVLYGTLNSVFFGAYEMAFHQCQKSKYLSQVKTVNITSENLFC